MSQSLTHFLLGLLLCFGYFNYFVIAEPISFFFQISSLTGQLLVNKFLEICSYIFEILKLTYSFFQILYEDSLIFINDAAGKFTYFIHILKEIYLLFEEFGWSILNGVYRFLESLLRILEFLQSTVLGVKQGIQLLGSTIWRVFTSFPQTVISSVNSVIDLLNNTFVEIQSSVQKLIGKVFETLEKIYQFVFDVPFDSIYGLIIGAILVTILCVKFREICYLTSSAFLKLGRLTISFASCLWSGRFLEQKSRYVEYDSEDYERLCIVCQNQPKDTIIFPCKHLCLCRTCTNQITRNRPLCPICRSDITGTLKVYL